MTIIWEIVRTLLLVVVLVALVPTALGLAKIALEYRQPLDKSDETDYIREHPNNRGNSLTTTPNEPCRVSDAVSTSQRRTRMSLKRNIEKAYRQASTKSLKDEFVKALTAYHAAEEALNKAQEAFIAAGETLQSAERTLSEHVVAKVNSYQMGTEVGHSFVTLSGVEFDETGNVAKRYPALMYVKTAAKLVARPVNFNPKNLRRMLREFRAEYLS